MFTTPLLPLVLAAASTGTVAPATGIPHRPITSVEIRLTPPDEMEEAQLESLLKRYRGVQVSEKVAKEATVRLGALPQYEQPHCRVQAREEVDELRCSLAKAPLIGRIRFEGLPAQLLEGDLRRRLFMRVGDPLAAGQGDTRGRLRRQRERLEQHLQRLGYYDAKVQIETPRIGKTQLTELLIRITEGRFLQVDDVYVEGDTIIPTKEIETAFRYMCIGGDGWLTFLETGRLDCFTRGRLRAVTERLENEMQRRGYPEAHLRVGVDRRRRSETRASCHSTDIRRQDRNPGTPTETDPLSKCVTLHVKVEPGPRSERWLMLSTEDPTTATSLGVREFSLGDWLHDIFRRGAARQTVGRAIQIAAGLPLGVASDTELSAKGLSTAAERREGTLLSVAPVEEATAWLERRVAESGYPAAAIEVVDEYFPDETPPVQRTTLRVHPGAPSAIREIRFLGNRSFTAPTLQEELTMLRPRSLRHSGFLSMDQLAVERRELEAFYESHGYLDVHVQARTERYQDDLVIVFYIDEGKRYQVDTLRFRGGAVGLIPSILPSLTHCRGGSAAMEGRTPITISDCHGSPLQPKALERDAEAIMKVYASRGYPYIKAEVTLAPEWNEDGAVLLIDIVDSRMRSGEQDLKASPLPRPVRLGEIFLVGNHRTSRAAILRESDLPNPGEYLTPTRVAQSIGRLRRTGLFSRVDYRYLGKDMGDEELALLLQLEERPVGIVDFAASFSTQDLMELSAEWRDRNLWGQMLDASLQADMGLFIGRRSNLELTLQWPRILGTDFGLRVHPRAVYSDHPTVRLPAMPGTPGPVRGIDAYQAVARRRIFSAGVKLGFDWSPQLPLFAGMQAGFDYELHTAWDNPNASRIPFFDQHTYAGWSFSLPSEHAIRSLDGMVDVFQQVPTRIATLGPRFKVHRIANPLDPTGGWSVDGAVAMSHPLIGASQPSFLIHTGARWYKSLHADFVLALHSNLWGGVTEVEAGSRSQLLQPGLISLGGDRTVRGYSFDAPFGVPLLAAEVASGARTGVIPLIGGVTNAEVRWTALRGLFLGDLKFAGFVDAGIVTDDTGLPWSTSWKPWHSPEESLQVLLRSSPQRVGIGLGAGVRYVMPIGPLALDIAFSPLTLRPQLHLQFGYAF